MPWQEIGWGCGSCLLRGAPSSVWQHFRHGAVLWTNTAENAAWWSCCCCSPEQGQPKPWLRPRRGEVRAPAGAVRGHVGAAREQQQRGLRSRCPAGQARWGEARSLLRNAAWPQAPAVFSKEVLALFSLRVQQGCAFLLSGVVVGNEGELPCWGFLKIH